MTVTRLIHWWWDGPPVPPEYLRFRDRWADLHPEWDLSVWNEDRWLSEFGRHPAASLYLNRARYSPHAHEWGWKTNIARYVLLQRYGGLWVDADLEPLRSVEPLIGRVETPGSGFNALAAYEDRTHVNNAFLASSPGGAFITAVVDGLGRRVKAQRTKPSNVATGPHYLTALHGTRRDLLALDRALIYPMHWSELERRTEEFPAAYTLHHWHRKTEEATRKTAPAAAAKTGPRRTGPVRVTRYGQGLGKVRVDRSGPTNRRTVIPRTIRQLKGLTPEPVMMALADMAAQVKPGTAIVELGVYQGKTALVMAWGASHGHGAHVFAFDPWDLPGERFPWSELQDPTKPHRPAFTDPRTRQAAEWNVKSLGYGKRITLGRAFSQDAGRDWAGPPVGMLYVDGDHAYDAVRGDLTAWARHLAPDAVVAFDDYASTHPEVIQAVQDMVSAGILEPVKVFHDRLGVTRLAPGGLEVLAGHGQATIVANGVTRDVLRPALEEAGVDDPDQYRAVPNTEPLAAITSEGVLTATDRERIYSEARQAGLSHAEAQGTAWPEEPDPMATQPVPPERTVVQAGELEGVAEGVPIEDLNTYQLRALAKARGIKLGTRKDKRDEMLSALRAGE